jgi:hypothetical protein
VRISISDASVKAMIPRWRENLIRDLDQFRESVVDTHTLAKFVSKPAGVKISIMEVAWASVRAWPSVVTRQLAVPTPDLAGQLIVESAVLQPIDAMTELESLLHLLGAAEKERATDLLKRMFRTKALAEAAERAATVREEVDQVGAKRHRCEAAPVLPVPPPVQALFDIPMRVERLKHAKKASDQLALVLEMGTVYEEAKKSGIRVSAMHEGLISLYRLSVVPIRKCIATCFGNDEGLFTEHHKSKTGLLFYGKFAKKCKSPCIETSSQAKP